MSTTPLIRDFDTPLKVLKKSMPLGSTKSRVKMYPACSMTKTKRQADVEYSYRPAINKLPPEELKRRYDLKRDQIKKEVAHRRSGSFQLSKLEPLAGSDYRGSSFSQVLKSQNT